MDTFQIFSLVHREKKCLGIRTIDYSLNTEIKKIPGIKWSQTHKCWYGEYTAEFEESLNKFFKNNQNNSINPSSGSKTEPEESSYKFPSEHYIPGSDENACIKKFVMQMEVMRLSNNTIINYKNSVMVFLKYFQNKDWRNLSQDDLNLFQKEVVLDRNLSSSYQQTLISAIKKFYEVNTSKNPDYNFIVRPKKGVQLPNILSMEEIKKLLTSTKNIKHRMMLSVIYACGLRAGDLINLKPTDIQSDRGMLHIKGGKGNKDRLVPISSRLIENLRDYYKTYRPVNWLFEGQIKGKNYTHRSLQLVLQRALKTARIKRKVRLHDLRHSYATHLMEAGTNQRLIQEALGHKNSKTTDIYTHVSKTNLSKMYNPFDDLGI